MLALALPAQGKKLAPLARPAPGSRTAIAANSPTTYSYVGKRLDISIPLSVASINYKPIHSHEAYMGVGISISGYFVLKNRKNSLGASLDFSGLEALEHSARYSSLMVGPAYSYNFNPFGKVHICLDIAAGYWFMRHVVSSNIFVNELRAMSGQNIHTLGIKAGVSLFKWNEGIPCEYRLNVKAPFSTTLLMAGENKAMAKRAFGDMWEISLSFGVRFGNY